MTDLRDAFFDELFIHAKANPNIIVLTADMGAKSLEQFKAGLPKQFFNVGIAEQNLISVAAGLALAGKKVYVYTISSFLIQRALDQIKVDLCGMNLPVILVGVGGGVSYSYDAFTHHIPQDIAIMNSLPNMTIRCPYDSQTTRQSVIETLSNSSPCYIRLEKGEWPDHVTLSKVGGVNVFLEGKDIAVVTYGHLIHPVLHIACHTTFLGESVSCLGIEVIKPFAEEAFLELIKEIKHLIIIEDHSSIGGLGAIISEVFVRRGILKKVSFYNIQDKFCYLAGNEDKILRHYGVDIEEFQRNLFRIIIEH